MAPTFNAIFYVLIFLSVYAQVFFFVTFLENRKKILVRSGTVKLAAYPSVTIVVPCWNEEKTVEGTVLSLLGLNYPKDKLEIFIVDDGSTDNTWQIIKKFASNPNIKIFRKENGGAYTAINFALQKSTTEFFGRLDADSFADPESLARIMSYFEKDPGVMAVAPSVIVHNPKGLAQIVQSTEYHMGVYLKKMLGFIGGINVTPGPLSVFRRRVFDNLGPYRSGHNTEDMEIAFRMQKNHYKIDHCNDAFVYTNTPDTLKKLYKQRLRWVYGFINNTIDYRSVLFKKKYGNFAVFTLPMGIISILSVSYVFGRIIYNFGNFLYSKIIQFETIGWRFAPKAFRFDIFFINTQSFLFLVFSIYFLVIFAMIFGRRMAEGKWGISPNIFYFIAIFSVIAPFWLMKAVYNTILQRKPAWR